MDTDQPIAQARANLSELLNNVRLLRQIHFLTSRSRRVAAVVPADLGEAIEQAGGVDRALEILKAQRSQS